MAQYGVQGFGVNGAWEGAAGGAGGGGGDGRGGKGSGVGVGGVSGFGGDGWGTGGFGGDGGVGDGSGSATNGRIGEALLYSPDGGCAVATAAKASSVSTMNFIWLIRWFPSAQPCLSQKIPEQL